MTEETNTSGWDAIDTAVGELYGDQEPLHYGTAIPYMLGGPDPLNGMRRNRKIWSIAVMDLK